MEVFMLNRQADTDTNESTIIHIRINLNRQII